MPSIEVDNKTSWADEVEDLDQILDGDSLPPPSESVENGIKTTVEYKYNEDGKKVKIVRTYKIEVKQVSKSIAMRKQWKKFGASLNDRPGPNPATTVTCEDVYMQYVTNKEEDKQQEDDALSKLRGNSGKVKCRSCNGEHWSVHCPYKGQIPEAPKDEKTGTAANPSAEEKSKDGKYVPPSLRNGGNRKGESMATTKRGEEAATVRVTNLSEDTRESDLQELFKPFGNIARIFLAKDKITGYSKGFAFINFHKREDAAKAIASLSGYGYDHLILKVEWAKPSTPQ